ncbi:MAG TPA: hypothetical protein PLI18_20075 [Pirellulaceae bacterium]|nr:hypothetical protein [Pirellulaceae bacterium]
MTAGARWALGLLTLASGSLGVAASWSFGSDLRGASDVALPAEEASEGTAAAESGSAAGSASPNTAPPATATPAPSQDDPQLLPALPTDPFEVRSLPEERKETLSRRRERFDRLANDEQERLRRLHRELTRRDDARALEEVLLNYNRWLESLTSIQRAELADLTIEDRIARIKELMRLQEEQTLRDLAASVGRADIEQIGRWTNLMAERHGEVILVRIEEHRRNMPANWSRFFANPPVEPAARARWLAFAMMALPPAVIADVVSDEDMATLRGSLGDQARSVLDAELTEEEQIAQVGRWLAADFASRMRAGISSAELERFFAEELDDATRAELDQKSPQDRLERLRDLYLRRGFGRGSRRFPNSPTEGPSRPERPALERTSPSPEDRSERDERW